MHPALDCLGGKNTWLYITITILFYNEWNSYRLELQPADYGFVLDLFSSQNISELILNLHCVPFLAIKKDLQ